MSMYGVVREFSQAVCTQWHMHACLIGKDKSALQKLSRMRIGTIAQSILISHL